MEKARGQASSVLAATVKAVGSRTPLNRLIFYRYDYMFSPRELGLLTASVTATRSVPGIILEVGCAGGNTTVFLNKHMDTIADERPYWCVDTFEGFTPKDIDLEVHRGKDRDQFRYVFKAYRKRWFDQTMANNGVTRVTALKADANELDFTRFSKVSLCLIDVDLYRPVRRCLDQVVPLMASGGIIIVDDCTPQNKYDGALAAYQEAIAERGLPVDIRFDKLGIIEVP